MSSELFAFLFDKCSVTVCDKIDTGHMPVVLSVLFPAVNTYSNVDDQLIFVDKYIWDSEKMLSFQNSFRSEDVLKKINDAISAVDNDVNDAMRLFMECLKDAAECMKKRVCVNGRRKGFDWFDEECKAQRRLVRKLLKKFRRSLEAHDRVSFCQVRRQYKNLIFRKKRQYNQTMIDTLVSSVNCQKEFWDNVHKIIPKRKTVKNQISAL